MNETPILMLCLGGQKTSLLAKSLHECGMSLGNGHTWWKQSDYAGHCEYSEITKMLGAYNDIPLDPEKVDEVVTRLRQILRAYREQAAEKHWKYYGIKTTSGICHNKWDRVKQTFFEEWPDALYFGLLRRPIFKGDQNQNEGWGNVYRARLELAETKQAVYLPYPEVFLTQEIQRFILGIGLPWKHEVMNIFASKRYREGGRDFQDEIMRGQYEHLLELSRRNFKNLFGETLELRSVTCS